MSEQALDLQLALSALRRRRRLLVAVTLAGGLAGALMAHLHPPMYSSSTMVLLPDQQSAAQSPLDMVTEARIVTSDAVLGGARKLVHPPLTRDRIGQLVTASSPSGSLLQIVARGSTAQAAESLARAVATSELAYEQQATSSLSQAERSAFAERQSRLEDQLAAVNQEITHAKGLVASRPSRSSQSRAAQTALAQLTAQQSDLALQIDAIKAQESAQEAGASATVVEDATPATRPRLVVWTIVAVLLAALVAAGLAAVIVIALARRDRRLRARDDLADALGSPVIGSVKSYRVRNTAGWSLLLESYRPSPTDAWSLRQILDRIGAGPLLAAAGGPDTHTPTKPDRLTVVAVVPADDPGALAVAGQLATHTASLGVATHLTARQRHPAADALWATSSGVQELRPGLRVDPRRSKSSSDLVLELAVVDRQQPTLPDLRRSDAIVLIVSAGTATEDDLARVAVAAYESGGRFLGIVVADPDSLDHTTGRLLQGQRVVEPPMPVKLTGVETDEWRERDRDGS